MSPFRLMIAAFFDGFSAPLHIFQKVRRPGSPSSKLERLTTPEMLEAYGNINTSIPGFLLEAKEQALKRDAFYSQCVRICGCLEILAMIGALCVIVIKQ